MEQGPTADDQSLATDLHVEATYRLTEALVEAERQMRRRVQLLSEVVFETDAEGRFVFLNDAWGEAVGEEPAACLGRQLHDFVLSEDRELCDRAMAGENGSAADAERPVIRMRNAAGVPIWMEMSVEQIPGAGAVGVLHDVTQQKLARDELARLSLVASHTDNFVVITDGQGRTEWVNEAFTGKTGFGVEDMRGRTPGEVLQGPGTDHETTARIGELLRAGSSVDAELLNYTRAGEPYWVKLNITPIHGGSGEVERFVSIQSDSTELRRTQHDLRVATERAEAASEAKTQFLATISHEMRTPLHAILASTELAQDSEGDPKAQHEYLEIIQAGGEALLRLITDILDVSKIETGEVEVDEVPVEIRSCVRGALAPAAEQAAAKGLAFELVFDERLPRTVRTDPGRLRQILTNLADNAVKFTDRGMVTVSLTPLAGEPGDRPLMELRVGDTGVGIPEDAQAQIFERFVQVDSSTTRSKGGVGLGLSIVRSLAEALGGTVSVSSGTGEGAEFRVLLPLEEVEPVAPPPADRAVPGPRRDGTRILVAEDNDVNFAVLEAYLEKAGYAVQRALTGREAVAGAPHCDLILMDLEMPEMDGLEATRHIRWREQEEGAEPIPIVAVTGHALREYRERCEEAGCTSYLSKPVRMQTLLEAVATSLGDRPEPSPA